MLSTTLPKKKVLYSIENTTAQPPFLFGEVQAWNRKTELQPASDYFCTEITLPAGVYQYKYYADGKWFTDPKNPDTITIQGNENSICVVNGISNPVIHAPGIPFLWCTKNNVLCIKAILRSDKSETDLYLRWTDSNIKNFTRLKMSNINHDTNTSWFNASIAPASSKITYFFETVVNGHSFLYGESGSSLIPFSINIPDIRQSIPFWWENAVIYEILIDRFHNPDKLQDITVSAESRFGGTINGIIDSLDHIKTLGATAVYITPIHTSDSVHRYDAVDFTQIDENLGGKNALVNLLIGLHNRDMRLILDISFNHVNKNHPFFMDIINNGAKSEYISWFKFDPVSNGDNGNFIYKCYNNDVNLPVLNMDNPEVQEYCISVFKKYLEYGIDGFRIDAAEEVPDSMLTKIAAESAKKKNRPALFGEIISPRSFRYLEWMDSRTDFSLFNHVRSQYMSGKNINCIELARIISEQEFFRGGPSCTTVNFLCSHDTDRLFSFVDNKTDVSLLYTLLLMLPGQPVIYYGEEIGLKSDIPPTGIFESSLHDRLPMIWDETKWNKTILCILQNLIRLRKKNTGCFTEGSFSKIDATESFLAYSLTHNHQSLEIYLNFSTQKCFRKLDIIKHTSVSMQYSCGSAELSGDFLYLGDKSAAVICRCVDIKVFNSNSQSTDKIINESFRSNTALKTFPYIAYISLTEQCNLHCRHCITGAGEKTSGNIYKNAQPWLIDALIPNLSSFDYLGFSHAGENMLSQHLEPLVKKFVSAKVNSSPTVHLLTNGMHKRELFSSIVNYGVNSLSVSLDGISEKSNDMLRVGSDYCHILSILKHLSEIKKNERLRFGVSVTLTKWNIGEMPELFSRIIENGTDWIKLEELYPVNALGKSICVPQTDKRIIPLIEKLDKICIDSGTVFIDHLDSDNWGMPCLKEYESSNFWKNDSYANSVNLFPCHLPWKVICIEPDGDVKPVSFYNQSAGNLFYQSLQQIIESQEFEIQKRKALIKCSKTGVKHNCPFQ